MKKLLAFLCLVARAFGGQSLVGVDMALDNQGFTFGTNFFVEGGWYKRMPAGMATTNFTTPMTNGPGTYRLWVRTMAAGGFNAYTNTYKIAEAELLIKQHSANATYWTNSAVFTVTNSFTNILTYLTNANTAFVHDWIVGGFYLQSITNFWNVNQGSVVNTTHFFADFTPITTTNTTDIVAGNIIPNSTFGNGMANDWGFPRDTFQTNSLTWQEEAIVYGDAAHGNSAFKISQDAGNFQLISPPLRSRGSNVARPYTLTTYAKLNSTNPATVTVKVQTTVPTINGVGTNLQVISMGSPTTNWQRFTNMFYFAPMPTREFYITWEHLLTDSNGVLIDSVQLEEGTNATPWAARWPVEVAIKTGRHGNMFLQGDPVVLQLTAYNSHATNRVISVATDIYYYDNSLASNLVTTVEVPPGASTNLIYPPTEIGPYRVQTRLLGNPDFDTSETSYAVAAFGPSSTTTLPNSNSWLGTHMPSTRQAVLTNRAWGVDMTRAFSTANMFRWSTIQPTSATNWNWSFTDVAVSNTAPTVTIYGAFNDIKGSPAWAMTSGVPQLVYLEAFASNVVARYKDRIGWWELMNEPYAGGGNWATTNAQELMTAALVTGIRAADPNARISAGVMDTTNRWLSLYAALSPTTRTQIQDVAFHYYPSYVGSAGANMNTDESYAPIKVSAELVRSQGYRAINSESGFWEYGNSHENGNWFTQGDYLWPFQQEEAFVRGHVFTSFEVMRQALRTAGNSMVYFHYYASLLGMSPTRPDSQPTLFNNNDSLKNQGLAYYTGVNFVGKGTPNGPITNTAAGVNLEAYGFQGNDGQAVVVAWALRPSTNWTVTITNTAFEVRNVFGKLIQTNIAAVTVGLLPVYIRSSTMATNVLNAEYVKAAVAGAGTLPAPNVSIDYSPEGALTKAPYWFKWTSASSSRVNYFTQPYQVLTRYRINGITADWSDWGSERQVVFDTLPTAGIYRLEVQTKDAVGAATNSATGPWFFVNDGPNWRIGTLSTP